MSRPGRERLQSALAPVTGVSMCVVRDDAVLLVKRASAAMRGLWSLPGGHVRFGETLKQAALRELAEETGVSAEIVYLIDCIDIINRDANGAIVSHFVLSVFGARWTAGEPAAASDAADARWVQIGDIDDYAMTPGTADLVRQAAPVITKN